MLIQCAVYSTGNQDVTMLYHIYLIDKRLNIQQAIRILADNLFVLPTAGFDPKPLVHYSTDSLNMMTSHLTPRPTSLYMY